jgi:hypothetical protein
MAAVAPAAAIAGMADARCGLGLGAVVSRVRCPNGVARLPPGSFYIIGHTIKAKIRNTKCGWAYRICFPAFAIIE